MRILTLDLGTHTGWAVQDDDLRASGTLLLATAKEIREQARAQKNRCCDIRFNRLQDFLYQKLPLGEIWFEDVEFSTYTYQTQLWAGFRTVVSLLHPRCRIEAVPVGTLKKFATSRGNADKKAMTQTLKSTTFWPDGRIPDDNEVDALHLLRYALWQRPPQIHANLT